MKTNIMLFITIIVMLMVTLPCIESLKCYQCADTTLESGCYQDYEGLVNTSKGLIDTYKKDCTDSNARWDRCVIEQHIGLKGEHSLFKRGCHDGKYFNINVDDQEFHNLTANNFTTCAKPKGELVCFTFCTGDYCNGPQEVKDPCINYTGPYEYINGTITRVNLPPGTVCGTISIFSHGSLNFTILLISILVLYGPIIKRISVV